MNVRPNTGLPIFELSIFVVVVLIGWAAFRLSEILPEQKEVQSVPSPTQVVAVTEPAKDSHLSLPDVIEKQDALKVRDELLAVANYVQSNFGDLENAFGYYVDRRNGADLKRFEQKAGEFRIWLEKQKVPATFGELQGKSYNLKEKIASSGMATTNATPLKNTWDKLLSGLELHYTNYLTAAQYFINNYGKPLTGEKRALDEQLAKASQEALQIRSLVREAREDGAALEKFVKTRPTPESTTAPTAPAAPAGKALMPAVASSPKADKIFLGLQYVYYSLIIALIALWVFLITSIYRRVVVTPLKLKLAESNTIIEHQNKLAHFGQLLAGLAHEIRNPLTAINARLYTLQKALGDRTPEHKDATVIRNEINRLEQIVRDFLKLARPAEPRFATLTAEPVLKEVKDLLAPNFERDSIELKLDSAVDAPFRADPQQLKQVLINLIQNAADSVGQNGTIILRARRGKSRAKENLEDAIVLEVEDTGTGIPPEVQDKLFDPFFSTKEDGTGLGLPIAARIIDKHGGALDFETQVGQGTTFRIELPVFQNRTPHGQNSTH
jgi:signal transduction histidine kinase